VRAEWESARLELASARRLVKCAQSWQVRTETCRLARTCRVWARACQVSTETCQVRAETWQVLVPTWQVRAQAWQEPAETWQVLCIYGIGDSNRAKGGVLNDLACRVHLKNGLGSFVGWSASSSLTSPRSNT